MAELLSRLTSFGHKIVIISNYDGVNEIIQWYLTKIGQKMIVISNYAGGNDAHP